MQKQLVRKAFDGEGTGLTQLPRSVPRTAVTWLGYNALTECVVAGVGGKAVTRVRYEDLVLEPGETIRVLGQQLGIELSKTADEIEVKRAVSAGCTFGGNRARMSGSLQLVLDEKWRKELSDFTKLATGMVTSPLLLRYGYQVFPSRVCEAVGSSFPKKAA
jgi:hypothetical protein